MRETDTYKNICNGSEMPIDCAMQAPTAERGTTKKEERTTRKVTNRQVLNFLLRAGTLGLRKLGTEGTSKFQMFINL